MKYELKCYEGDDPRIESTEEFIVKNKLSINFEEVKRIMENPSDKDFGFDISVAIDYISLEDDPKHFKEDYKKQVKEGKAEHHQITDVYEAAHDFLDYMVFAWRKARDERGLSAGRSITKLAAWMKILNRPDVAKILNDDNLYAEYGKPALRKACEMLGINCPGDIK